ncbi:MAG: GIY-YIG nuclease family protein [Tepidisphaerales bacterium]
MMDFFPSRPLTTPAIYAFSVTHAEHAGLLKVGYTERPVAQRVAEQFPTGFTGYDIRLIEPATRPDGTTFTDHDVHRQLRQRGIVQVQGEWFRCTVDDVRAAVLAVRERRANVEGRTLSFGLRPEQARAVEMTAAYFLRARHEQPGRTPHFLWNAKMRFGKTFAAYQLARRMGWKRVLVMTFKPVVVHAWQEDLERHIDFEGWQFVTRGGMTFEQADETRPIVCFGSFQDFLQRTKEGAIKARNEWVHLTEWDCVILDEYHFGAWRDNARGLFGSDEEEEGELEREMGATGERGFDEQELPITTRHYLYLSGTPFRALASGEFIEEQIYNWTYSDEQRAKRDWSGPGPNPYASLPRLVLMTYTLPDEIRRVAEEGEFNEFDLNEFFRAEGEGDLARFVHEEEVQKWLDLIRGQYRGYTVEDLKLGREKPPMPFSDIRLLGVLNHSVWFLPDVASCYAMANLLKQRQNTFYHEYKVVVAAGPRAGIGAEALPPVEAAMGSNPLESKTITLTCGKLTTGVTVRPWAGMLMLRKCSSPETYFQSAFRVQSPWTTRAEDGSEVILKPECYVFDFAPNRALRQIADYGSRLSTDEATPEQRVAELIGFLPVLAYDGSAMRQLNAEAILDLATAGTSATLLAKRWESVLLVNVDDSTLSRLMSDEAAMRALMNIEGFRNLNQELTTIINRSQQIRDTKRRLGLGEEVSEAEKRELTEAEKERRTLRKQIQQKLLKFAARIPVFMYLTDFREQRLKDVITSIEPRLFQKVTGLTKHDFEKLVTLGVFNRELMNDAVWKFRRYEDASLRYLGIERHRPLEIGLWDTVLTEEDFKASFTGTVNR